MKSVQIPAKAKQAFKSLFPVVGLVFVLLLSYIINGNVLFTKNNLMSIFNDSLYVMILACAYVFLLSMSCLDFSISSVVALACACAVKATHIDMWIGIPVALLVGLAAGCLNGLVVTKLRINSFIGTLSMSFIYGGITTLILMDGSNSAPFKIMQWNNYTVKIIILAVCIIVSYVLFEFTSYGKRCMCIGAGEEAAHQTGINITGTKMIAFATMGLLAGTVGILSLIRSATAQSSTGSSLMFETLIATLLGGIPITGGHTTKFRAAILGSLTIAVLGNGMTQMGLNQEYKQLVKGIVFLVAVAITFDRKSVKVIK